MKKEKEPKHFIEKPTYKGGEKALTEFIYKNLRYPQAAAAAGVEGTVFIEYDIDFQGNVVDAHIRQSLGHGCDEEAVRVVKLLKFEVGKYRGMKVVFHRKARIEFRPVKQRLAAAVPVLPTEVQYNYVIVPSEKAPEAKPTTNGSGAGRTYSYIMTLG